MKKSDDADYLGEKVNFRVQVDSKILRKFTHSCGIAGKTPSEELEDFMHNFNQFIERSIGEFKELIDTVGKENLGILLDEFMKEQREKGES